MNRTLSVVLLGLSLVLPQAHAGLIPTDDAVQRSQVKRLIERTEVAAQLERMGIPLEAATGRVDAMTDDEVRDLAGRIENLYVGGQNASDWSGGDWINFAFNMIPVLLLLILLIA